MNYQKTLKLSPLGEFRVMTLREGVPSESLCDTGEKVEKYWRENILTNPQFSWETQEVFATIMVSTRQRIIGHNVVSCGILDRILVHPRDVFRPAIVAAAAAIILGHYHPSGDPTPSEDDIRVTRELIRAGQLLKIEVLDHVIIGRPTAEQPRGYKSMRELGFFY
jgi:DNA repair protein RadC